MISTLQNRKFYFGYLIERKLLSWDPFTCLICHKGRPRLPICSSFCAQEMSLSEIHFFQVRDCAEEKALTWDRYFPSLR